MLDEEASPRQRRGLDRSGVETGVSRVSAAARRLADWYLRDPRSGEVVLYQSPNLPILLWLGTLLARWLVEDGSELQRPLEWSSLVTLGWWALDELVRGVNPWRRTLGLVGCVVVVFGALVRAS